MFESLRYDCPDSKLPEAMLKQISINLLLALDLLHSECHIVDAGEVAPLAMLWKTLTGC